MSYILCTLQNTSNFSEETPTIIITTNHPNWKEIVRNWKQGIYPTNDSKWAKGIFAIYQKVEEE